MEFDVTLGAAVLERTPATLDRMLRGLPSSWATATEGPETWSPFDIVGHLIDGEETDWIPRARIMLSDAPERRLPPFDQSRHLTRNRGRSLDQLLDEFAALRSGSLAALRGFRLTALELARTAVHPDFGAVTLRQHLATWVAHDLNHIGQIARVMARQYSLEVGPWRAFLPILHPRSIPSPG